MQKTNNLQEIFLTQVRRDRRPVTMFLMNGFQMRGYVTGFDAFTVVLTRRQTADCLQARHFHHCPRAARTPVRAGGRGVISPPGIDGGGKTWYSCSDRGAPGTSSPRPTRPQTRKRDPT